MVLEGQRVLPARAQVGYNSITGVSCCHHQINGHRLLRSSVRLCILNNAGAQGLLLVVRSCHPMLSRQHSAPVLAACMASDLQSLAV